MALVIYNCKNKQHTAALLHSNNHKSAITADMSQATFTVYLCPTIKTTIT